MSAISAHYPPMPPRYRKTPKGQHEMASRSHRLSPRQRAALILVDGRRSTEDICRLLGPQACD
jgi:DNA-binding CsgD family transcriptional regulator